MLAVAVNRIKDAERFQDPSEQLSWAGNEMSSVIRDRDSVLIDLPVAWAGLAMVHEAQHGISAAFESKQTELMDLEDRAVNSLKQVFLDHRLQKYLHSMYMIPSDLE